MKGRGSGHISGFALAAALLAAVSVHAVGFAWFHERTPEVQIVSTRSISLSVVGSIDDLISGSLPADTPDEIAEIEEQEPEQLAAPIKDNKPVEPVRHEASKPSLTPLMNGVTAKAEKSLERLIEGVEPEVVTPKEVKLTEPKEIQPPKQDDFKELKPAEKAAVEPAEKRQEQPENPPEPVVATPTMPVPRARPPRPTQPAKSQPVRKAKAAPVKTKRETAQKVGNAKTDTVKGSRAIRKGTETAKQGNAIAGSGDSAGNAAKSSYWGKVQRKIQRAAERRYPKREKNRKKTGVVRVSFVINRNGSVTAIKLSRSSGNKRLDQAALKAISAAAPFPPFPSSMRAKSIQKVAPIIFRLSK
ncbi:cell envelope integrity inner membrane protein TolA [Pseudovibrio axinellae]|uniref:Cell envelope integrity inner membrane protein TolA n=1 Tax=Pseudovibrio axinellae TaxID=989403 RepID=A0A165ZS99_9HYPH|nr:TonB family protein [Pseudovibrio axinellae]KZL20224.1 cell envelope integrity inner membrane protein TolA [Pseudovibrio axinellae]SEQ61672.1 protein TonB [Pseudovibrio axinellae]